MGVQGALGSAETGGHRRAVAAWNRARGAIRGRAEVTWGQQTAAHLYDDDTQLENAQAVADQVSATATGGRPFSRRLAG